MVPAQYDPVRSGAAMVLVRIAARTSERDRRDLTTFSRGWSRYADCPLRFRVGGLMHDLDRAAEQIAITLNGVNDIGGHRKFGSAADQV